MERRALILPLMVGMAVGSSQSHALQIDASADVAVEYTDNARRSGGRDISETQEYIAVAVKGEHGGEAVTADFQYVADRRFYNDNSQDDESTLEGFASVVWEQIDETLFWELSHRRKDVLRDNALVDIRENRDERDITEITPLYIMRLTPVDSLQARLNYSMIVYRDAETLDSQRYGGSLTWAHQLSPTDAFFVSAESNEVDFDSSLQDDYRYDAGTLAYSSQLARINYRLTLGYNKANRDRGDDFSSPIYALEAQYNDGVNLWNLLIDSRISDSSLGDGNQYIFDGLDITDTTLGQVDIIQKTRFEAGVTTPVICTICEVRATIFFDQEDYDRRPRDNDEYGLELSGNVRLSARSTVTTTYRYRSVEYQGDQQIIDFTTDDFFLFDDGVRSDYDQHELLVAYGYRFTDSLRGEAFVGHSNRSTSESSGQDYDETRVGLRLSYDFY